jgi:hypothetical protein
VIDMSREKRSAHLQAKVFPSTRERVKQRLAGSNIISVSDYLFELIERDLHEAETVAVVKQKLGVRAGRN